MIILGKLHLRLNDKFVLDEDWIYSTFDDAIVLNKATDILRADEIAVILEDIKVPKEIRELYAVNNLSKMYKILTSNGVVGFIWSNPDYWEPVQK